MNAFDEYRDNGAQIGVNGVATGAIHRVAKHSCMYGIAKDVDGAAEIDLRFDVSRRFRCLKPTIKVARTGTIFAMRASRTAGGRSLPSPTTALTNASRSKSTS
jgi:hypothetical protein